MKVRTAHLLLAVCSSVTVVTAAQDRPSFTGTWKFVADKSTPSDRPAFGREFRINHEANALVLELPTREFVMTPERKLAPLPDGLGAPMAFKTDGDEHVMLPLNPMQSLADRTTFNLMPGGKYRVSWKRNALVINSSDDLPISASGRVEFVHRVIETTFSMNPDGALLVERTTQRDPATKGQIEYGRTEQKSVYRKAP
jgi:hypothetical protein